MHRPTRLRHGFAARPSPLENVLPSPPAGSAGGTGQEALAQSAVELADVDAALDDRRLLRLTFPSTIETRYEADTRAARAWNIRLAAALGLAAYLLFSLSDRSILPDLGLVPTAIRLLVVAPVGFFAMWMCTRASAAFREAYIALAVTAMLLIAVTFVACSRAPLAPYATVGILLVSMFGNITIRLRFPHACAFSAASVIGVGVMLWWRSDLDPGLSGAIFISLLTCVCFGIVANNQLERAERLAYLMALRERLSAERLSAAKDVFSVLSLTDALTGLANRRAFDAAFDRCVEALRESGRPFSVVLVDVDFFKQYNDHYGHPAGDACLVQIASIIGVGLAGGDLAVRYGGEEFALLLAGQNSERAALFADRLCARVRKAGVPHFHREDGLSVVTVSAGVATVDRIGDGDPRPAALSSADLALYAAKRSGRNRAVLAAGAGSRGDDMSAPLPLRA